MEEGGDADDSGALAGSKTFTFKLVKCRDKEVG